MTAAPAPPRSLDLYVEVLGLDDTLRLIEAHGGTKLWVPKGVGNSSAAAREKLEAEFGKPMVRELIAAFGGDVITVPLCQEWRTALYEHQGLPRKQIAIKLGCHEETVQRRLRRRQGILDQHAFRF